jgi:hypothetical protein
MNKQFKYTPLAFAMAALFASPLALANENGDSNGMQQHGSVDIDKEIWLGVHNDIYGQQYLYGDIYTESSSIALVKDRQENHSNYVDNDIVDNNAVSGDEALKNAAGNVGYNDAAGDNNQQANDAALAAVDAEFVFADAETFARQTSSNNETDNYAVRNSAGLIGEVLKNAAGNIGVNVAAGNSNQQKNDMAISSNSSGTFAQATSAGRQSAYDNDTTNTGAYFTIEESTAVSLSGSLSGAYVGAGGGSYSGSHGGSYSGSHSGSSTGTADQIGDVYPDIWANDPGDEQVHPTDNPGPIGHADLDTNTQGGSDLNGDGGALAFNTDSTYSGRQSGTYSGSQSGDLGFIEIGAVGLSGTFTGQVVNIETVFRPHENNAGLGGQALMNAAGNIGVNVAAGTNNQQRNSLAIASAMGGNPGNPGGGGGGEQ